MLLRNLEALFTLIVFISSNIQYIIIYIKFSCIFAAFLWPIVKNWYFFPLILKKSTSNKWYQRFCIINISKFKEVIWIFFIRILLKNTLLLSIYLQGYIWYINKYLQVNIAHLNNLAQVPEWNNELLYFNQKSLILIYFVS